MHPQRIRQRRRRVTLDTSQSEEFRVEDADAGEAVRAPRRPAARPYTSGARRSRQFKTTDLIPKRIWSVTAVIALLLAAIAGLNLLHLHSPDWVDVIGNEGVAALSLDSGRGIAVWYSNFLLLLTSCVSLQLFLLRQHRRDDYRGSYRVWMWLALIFLMASAASVTGIAAVFRNLVQHLAGAEPGGSALLWVFLLKLAGLTLLVVRGLVEMRHSRLAVVGLLLVLAGYGMAHLINEVPEVRARSSEYVHAALGNSLLFACTALFVSVLGFARYVYLNANGLTRARDHSRAARQAARTERREQLRQKRAVTRQEKQEHKQARRQQRLAQAAADEESGRNSSRSPLAGSEDAKRQRRLKKTSDESKTSATKSRRSAKPAAGDESSRGANRMAAADEHAASRLTGDEYLMSVSEEDVKHLSKSERRRLRKLKRRADSRAA
jgi:hypothetical protein